MTVLSVNLNKIALIRNSREGNNPDILSFAIKAVEAGAQGITVHPRPDQRHIRPSDVQNIRSLLEKSYANIEFNIEGNPYASANEVGYPGFDQIIASARPEQVTLVPDNETQLTSDHGWNLEQNHNALARKINKYKNMRSRVSLFLDPEPAQIKLAKEIGADRIELYTGPFASTFAQYGPSHELTLELFKKYVDASELANQLKLEINAGHDLNLGNLALFSKLPYLAEVSIGHAIVVDSFNRGFQSTIQDYLEALQRR